MQTASTNSKPLSIAIIGAGPAGLSLALFAAEKLPYTKITLYDSRSLEADLYADKRVLALSYGSVQFLKRIKTWSEDKCERILKVNVSQQQPTLMTSDQQVWIDAKEMSVPMLGAVIPYPEVLAPMQKRWLELSETEPKRLKTSFADAVKGVKNRADGQVEVDAKIATTYDLVVMAEGGIFAEQTKKPVVSDYKQKAWVGRAVLQEPMHGIAYERFTASGPAALLPLGQHVGALVWCQPTEADDVEQLTSEQRLAVINTVFTPEVGSITELTELKSFDLGLNAEKTLINGRTVVIGNAAQTLHPVAGQGLNLGLRDVFTLVDKLSQNSDIDKALKQMTYSRQVDRWSVIGTTELLARGFTWSLPLMPELRNMALGGVQLISPLKKLLAKQMIYGWR